MEGGLYEPIEPPGYGPACEVKTADLSETDPNVTPSPPPWMSPLTSEILHKTTHP